MPTYTLRPTRWHHGQGRRRLIVKCDGNEVGRIYKTLGQGRDQRAVDDLRQQQSRARANARRRQGEMAECL
jgi:hypothetical protein